MHVAVLNGRCRIAAAAIAGFALWLASAPGARADVTVKIGFDFVETRVSPRQETYNSHIFPRVTKYPPIRPSISHDRTSTLRG